MRRWVVRALYPTMMSKQRPSAPEPLPQQYSAFLDLWRLGATGAVFLGHLTRPDVLFDVDVAPLGRGTIPTFLIISAYLAAMSFQRGGQFVRTVGERYVSLYAVFIPASVLVLFMDLWLLNSSSPLLLNDKFDPVLSASAIARELFELLTFSGEYWSASTLGQGVFSNQAFWTMDYIMAYTVATAGLYLLRGWKRWLTVAGVAVVAGPTVVLLAPIWFAGVVVFELQRRRVLERVAGPRSLRAIGIALVVGAVLTWTLVELRGWGAELYAWSKTLAPYELRQYLGMAKRFLWQWAYILPLMALLFGARFVLTGSMSTRWRGRIARAAQYALPLYAIHFTLIYLVHMWLPGYEPRADHWGPYVLGIVALTLSLAFGYVQLRWVAGPARRLRKRLFDQNGAARDREAGARAFAAT